MLSDFAFAAAILSESAVFILSALAFLAVATFIESATRILSAFAFFTAAAAFMLSDFAFAAATLSESALFMLSAFAAAAFNFALSGAGTNTGSTTFGAGAIFVTFVKSVIFAPLRNWIVGLTVV